MKKYILSFAEFINEAKLSKHYLNRKEVRIYDNGKYTTPTFNVSKYDPNIKFIEDIIYPSDQKFVIITNLDKKYINSYKGGDFPYDKADKSNGSIGTLLYVMVEYNETVTIYFSTV